jgi:hypothetical protein
LGIENEKRRLLCFVLEFKEEVKSRESAVFHLKLQSFHIAFCHLSSFTTSSDILSKKKFQNRILSHSRRSAFHYISLNHENPSLKCEKLPQHHRTLKRLQIERKTRDNLLVVLRPFHMTNLTLFFTAAKADEKL